MDLRTPVTVTAYHRTHRRSVLCVSASSNYVFSGGEDRLLCVWDIRKTAVLDQITVRMEVGVASRVYGNQRWGWC